PSERIVARQLRRALESYLNSNNFNPTATISPDQLSGLIGETSMITTASSAHGDYPATLATDGNPQTFWHTDWNAPTGLPASLSLDLLAEKVITGFNYLPRQDQVNGRIKSYRIQISN